MRLLTPIVNVTGTDTVSHVIKMTLCLERGVDDRVRHDGGVVREDPDLHLFGLVGPDWRHKRLDFATVHSVAIECEAKLITQVTCHCLEIVLDGHC